MIPVFSQVSHYLYHGLPLHLWIPSDADSVVLRCWLIDHDIRSAENQLARILIEQLNWSFSSMVMTKPVIIWVRAELRS